MVEQPLQEPAPTVITTVNTAMIPAARRAVSESWSSKRAVSGTFPERSTDPSSTTGAWRRSTSFV